MERAVVGRAAAVYIYTLAFLAGAAVMIVELAASRLLSPHFGNTIYTWTALIGVIMLALSVGYYAGGWLADRHPSPPILAHLVLAAAVLVLLVPLLTPWVTGSLAADGQPVDLVWGPLTAALLIFALPGCLLGTVTPFSVKLISLRSANEQVGASAGTISMLSTIGSVLGTFAAGFVLIPSVGVRSIFAVVGASLALAAAPGYVGLLGASRRAAGVIALLSIALAGLASLALHGRAAGTGVLHETDSPYHHIRVQRIKGPDGRAVRLMLMNGAPEGAEAETGERLVYQYTKYYRLERFFCGEMKRAAFLGGGAFSIPKSLVDDHPHVQVDAVEIDPAAVDVARQFFGLGDYEPQIRAIVGDGRGFLASTPVRYDLIFGDAFRGRQTVPPHMVTVEFFELVRSRLTGGGVYMMNVMGSVEGPQSRFAAAVINTLQRVFPEVYVFITYPTFARTKPQNLILVAPNRPVHYTKEDLVRRAEGDKQMLWMADNLLPDGGVDRSDALLLTDDFSPVEYMAGRQLANH